MRLRRFENGNIIFIILIAVALFAALSLAVSNMMRGGGTSGISEEKAQLAASEILGYGRAMRQVVQDIRISNGCEDTDISFESPYITGYEHSPEAVDSCKIFHPRGGALSYPQPADEWLDAAQAGSALYGEWYLSGDDSVVDLGEAGSAELIAFLPWMSAELCAKINEVLNITLDDKEAAAFATGNKFTGEYGADGLVIGTAITALHGKTAGCLKDAASNSFFYQVLISR